MKRKQQRAPTSITACFSMSAKMLKQMQVVRRKTEINWSAYVRKAIQRKLDHYY